MRQSALKSTIATDSLLLIQSWLRSFAAVNFGALSHINYFKNFCFRLLGFPLMGPFVICRDKEEPTNVPIDRAFVVLCRIFSWRTPSQ